MADVMTKKQRSYCMSRIRGRDTQPEILLRKALWSAGYRYRLKSKLPGKPDILFPGRKVAIFVDGCFWHGCPDHSARPKTNAVFWSSKIDKNIDRDRKVTALLTAMGWKVVRIWEHELTDENVVSVAKTCI